MYCRLTEINGAALLAESSRDRDRMKYVDTAAKAAADGDPDVIHILQ
jgi:hypothetical protein